MCVYIIYKPISCYDVNDDAMINVDDILGQTTCKTLLMPYATSSFLLFYKEYFLITAGTLSNIILVEFTLRY